MEEGRQLRAVGLRGEDEGGSASGERGESVGRSKDKRVCCGVAVAVVAFALLESGPACARAAWPRITSP